MRRSPYFSLAAILLLALAASPAMAIINGEPDTEYEYPYVGQQIFDVGQVWMYRGCSGILIHERVFLTAGHCWYGTGTIPSDPSWVSFSLNSLDAPESWVPVAEWHRHPGFNPDLPNSRNPDISLMILAEPVTGIAPVSLPPEGYIDDLWAAGLLYKEGDPTTLTAVGYGMTLSPPPQPDYDMTDLFGTRAVASVEYRALTENNLMTSQHWTEEAEGICQYDSGSPVLYTDENGARIALGTASKSDAFCLASIWYVRMDTDEILDWIQEIISGL